MPSWKLATLPSKSAAAFAAAAILGALSGTVQAQTAGAAFEPPKLSANDRQAYLVRQDQSDCTNTTVPKSDSLNAAGNIWLTRGSDGTTSIKVAMTAQPNTTYQVFLKCVRQLGDIKTDDEGTGIAEFSFPTNSVGATFAFDVYPQGAPAGNKFQSATVSF